VRPEAPAILANLPRFQNSGKRTGVGGLVGQERAAFDRKSNPARDEEKNCSAESHSAGRNEPGVPLEQPRRYRKGRFVHEKGLVDGMGDVRRICTSRAENVDAHAEETAAAGAFGRRLLQKLMLPVYLMITAPFAALNGEPLDDEYE
jgi:hypothetical protein